MGITIPTTLPARQQKNSIALSRPLMTYIQKQELCADMAKVHQEQSSIKKRCQAESRKASQAEANTVITVLPPMQRRGALAAQEKGALSWLSAVPVKDLGFALHKGAFRDAIALRSGWQLRLAPSRCRCGHPFEVDHVLSCRHGGYHTLRHNETRDLLATLLKEVCREVSIEPRLQPLSGERLPRSANSDDEARLDIQARGFWGSGNGQQDAFFDVRVFYPFASSYRNSNLKSLYKQHETQKRLHYARRVIEIEHGCFTPLVFTTGGGMAPEATVCVKRLSSMIAEKRQEHYSVVMGWLRCAISFCLLRSSLACLRGSFSAKQELSYNIAEAVAAGRLK